MVVSFVGAGQYCLATKVFMYVLKHFAQLPGRVIASLENTKVSFALIVLTFLFIITLRLFVESFSTHYEMSLILFTHYYLIYIAIAMSLILLFHLATKTSISKIAKVVLPCFLILVVAPTLDLLISGGKGLDMGYLLPELHPDLLWRFLAFFGEFEDFGVTPGMKIEIALALVASFIYFLTKGAKIIKSLCFTFLTYTTIFAFSISPFVVKVIAQLFELTLLEFPFSYSDDLLVNYLATVIILIGGVTAYLANRQRFISIIKDIRLLRILYYLSMFIVGVAFGFPNIVLEITATNIYHFLFIPISLTFACLFSIVTNNIADYEIDKAANPNRPLVSASISYDVYKKLTWPFIICALFYAAITNLNTLFLIALFMGNYFLYSMPPIRLKRIPFFSKLTISLNSLALIMLGFNTITNSLSNLPGITYPIVLIGMTAVANMIDIKDYHGDKQAGIKTLPVIMGLTRAKILIGVFFLLTYSALFFVVDFLNAPLFWSLIFVILGIIQFFLIIRKNYNENPVLLAGLFSIGLVTYLIFKYAY